MQQHKTLLAILLALFALSAWASASEAAERKAARKAKSAAGGYSVILLQKRATFRGGYSYGRSEVATPFGHSRGPWAVVRQSPGGPFDSGFFFDSGLTPLNNAPYPK